jgi:hypothetical protein
LLHVFADHAKERSSHARVEERIVGALAQAAQRLAAGQVGIGDLRGGERESQAVAMWVGQKGKVRLAAHARFLEDVRLRPPPPRRLDQIVDQLADHRRVRRQRGQVRGEVDRRIERGRTEMLCGDAH